MYRLRDVTLSFTMRKWHTYECPFHKAPSLGRGGEGLPPNPSPQSVVIKRVTPNGEVFLFVATLG